MDIFFKVLLPEAHTIQTAALWDQPKHPVAIFNEYCAKNSLELRFEISEEPYDNG